MGEAIFTRCQAIPRGSYQIRVRFSLCLAVRCVVVAAVVVVMRATLRFMGLTGGVTGWPGCGESQRGTHGADQDVTSRHASRLKNRFSLAFAAGGD